MKAEELQDEVDKLKIRLMKEQGRHWPFTAGEVRDGLNRVLASKADLRDKMQSVVSFGTLTLCMYYEFLWEKPLTSGHVIRKLLESGQQAVHNNDRTEQAIAGMINNQQPLNYTLHHAIAKALAYLRDTK